MIKCRTLPLNFGRDNWNTDHLPLSTVVHPNRWNLDNYKANGHKCCMTHPRKMMKIDLMMQVQWHLSLFYYSSTPGLHMNYIQSCTLDWSPNHQSYLQSLFMKQMRKWKKSTFLKAFCFNHIFKSIFNGLHMSLQYVFIFLILL